MKVTKKTHNIIKLGIVPLFVTLLCFNTLPFSQNQTPIPSKNPIISKTQTSKTNPSNVQNQIPESQPQGTEQATKTRTSLLDETITVVNPESPTPTFQTASGKTYPLRTYELLETNSPSLATNDYWASQWWTTSTNLETAWSIGAGSTPTVVAVIDAGFALAHEEFTNRWATNNSEQGATTYEVGSSLNCTDRGLTLDKSCNLIDDDYNTIVDDETGSTTIQNPSKLNCTDLHVALDKSCNQIDDDDNGYVDDVTGWDFANFDSNVQAGEVNPNGSGTMHGTEVTGVLAATGDNGVGIAGVNWTTKILPIQVFDDMKYGNTLFIARAIEYAADRNVDVISLSSGAPYDDTYVRQSIQYALDKGSLVVAASGNDGCNCMIYPARYPEVFAVGSQSPDGNASIFSNYGANIDIMAPGENIRTTAWSSSHPTNEYVANVSGTSFSTPYISGLLSLARSHQPNATWGELTNILKATARHTGLTVNIPWTSRIGSGYADAGSLMTRVTTPKNPGIRYEFGSTPIKSILSSNRVYQCDLNEDFPTAQLFKISSSSSTFYTIDNLEYVRAQDRGSTFTNLGYFCVGLPSDSPSVLRKINLLNEIDNNISKTQ